MSDSSIVSSIQKFREGLELEIYKEYNSIIKDYKYSIETDRRLYFANEVNVEVKNISGDVYYDVTLNDVWIYDIYRTNKKIKSARILSFRDVNVNEH